MTTRWGLGKHTVGEGRPWIGTELRVKHILSALHMVSTHCAWHPGIKALGKCLMNKNEQSLNYISWRIEFNPSKDI